MPNTFLTPSAVVRDAALYLNDSLIIGNLVNRNVEQTFASKVGTTVDVKAIPNMGSADEFSSITSASDVTETKRTVTLEKHFYKRVDLTTNELTLEADDFNQQVAMPAVRSLIRSTEGYLAQKIIGGFSPNMVGTAGNSPSTHAHILAAEKEIFDNRGDNSQLVGLITSTAHAAFGALNIFTSMDYGQERPAGLRSNSLGMMSNVNWFRSPNLAYTRGDVAGTVLVNATTASGTSLPLKAFTETTGTVYEGTRFIIAGDATVYTVTADATIASNAATLVITPTLAASAAENAAITFQSAPSANVVYNPQGVAAAIVPPAAVGPLSAISNVNGLGIRIVSSDISTSTLAASWVFDILVGARVTMNEFGAVMQG